MAGHSKWANTKHRKTAQDIKKSKIFTKIIKDITISSMNNGPDSNKNFQLRNLLEKARLFNVGKDIIEKAIKRSTKNSKKDIFYNKKYSGYGPSGTAIIIHCNTNNSNRTVSQIRNIFSKFNSHLIKFNSIKYLFNFLFTIQINLDTYKKNIVTNLVQHNKSIIDYRIKKQYLVIKIQKSNFKEIKKYFLISGIQFSSFKLTVQPKNIYPIDDENKKVLINMIMNLKKLKETIEVIHNAKI
ncbi:YebC/PmpR family DNA-binding transcriptional regulator [Buchnera aphidicola]|uniref:Probable transcriptional regulatory protein BUCINSTRO3249_0209 n=1 Tax=Buchnera aphidicola (Cinara strobi) TaxID=1921549 RepID=A0A3B1E7V8_9GAMM|nr:YebC/PmpR family DNA-binding transcriptional regulator [Buchnera aphidicola]VAX76567.1 Probable transcriptional regulatory protein YebC [Buchnera aphidicola (Cinara strobi)]